MKEKNIIIFMPTIDSGGGVEKNFFIITNYLSKKFNKVTVITLAKSTETKLNKNVNIISPKLILVNYLGRRAKFLVALIYLLKAIISNKNPLKDFCQLFHLCQKIITV